MSSPLPPPGDPRRPLIGQRVVVRYRLPEPDEFGHSLTDVIGEVTHLDGHEIAVRTRRGELIRVERSAVVGLKPVPPAPPRRRPWGPQEERSPRAD